MKFFRPYCAHGYMKVYVPTFHDPEAVESPFYSSTLFVKLLA